MVMMLMEGEWQERRHWFDWIATAAAAAAYLSTDHGTDVAIVRSR